MNFKYFKVERGNLVTNIVSTCENNITSLGVNGKNNDFSFHEKELIEIGEQEFEDLLKLTDFFTPKNSPPPSFT